MTEPASAWRHHAHGLLVRVRVTPKSQDDRVDGLERTSEGPALKVRVRAVPADGAANAAVQRILAEWLGVAKSSVSLAAGGKSRVKTLLVAGNADALQVAAEARLAQS